MAAHHLPRAISHTAAVAASEAPAEHNAAWLMHLHLELGGGFGSRHFSRRMMHV